MRAIAALALLLPVLAWAGDSEGSPKEGKRLFEAYCGACHSLELPRSQHLNRVMWEWVVDDMVNNFGATWITPREQELIIDYLVVAHGPKE